MIQKSGLSNNVDIFTFEQNGLDIIVAMQKPGAKLIYLTKSTKDVEKAHELIAGK